MFIGRRTRHPLWNGYVDVGLAPGRLELTISDSFLSIDKKLSKHVGCEIYEAVALAGTGAGLAVTLTQPTNAIAGAACSGDAILLEPGQHLLPAVFRRFLAIGRPIVGVKAVRHVRVEDERAGLTVLVALLQHFLQAGDLVD